MSSATSRPTLCPWRCVTGWPPPSPERWAWCGGGRRRNRGSAALSTPCRQGSLWRGTSLSEHSRLQTTCCWKDSVLKASQKFSSAQLNSIQFNSLHFIAIQFNSSIIHFNSTLLSPFQFSSFRFYFKCPFDNQWHHKAPLKSRQSPSFVSQRQLRQGKRL